MTTLTEKLPTMALADLNSLLKNARRLAEDGAGKTQVQAAEIVPLIEAELLVRKPAPVAKAPRKRAPAAPKAAKAAKDAAAAKDTDAE
jgi:hypothetical protein